MCQADAEEAENGYESINRDKHDKQVAKPCSDIVPLVIGEVFSAAVKHCQQTYDQAGAEKENQETQDHQHDRTYEGKVIQPGSADIVKESHEPQQDQLDQELDHVAERDWYARLLLQVKSEE